jgi:hypothetical protein
MYRRRDHIGSGNALTTYDRNDTTRRQVGGNVNGAMKGASHGGISEFVGPSRRSSELLRRLEVVAHARRADGSAVPRRELERPMAAAASPSACAPTGELTLLTSFTSFTSFTSLTYRVTRRAETAVR